MSTPYRSLQTETLRDVVAGELLDWGSPGREGFALTLEALAHEVGTPVPAPEPALAPRSRPIPSVPTTQRLLETLGEACRELHVPLEPDRRWTTIGPGGVGVSVGPGGQVRVHSELAGTPGRAAGTARILQDDLRAALRRRGMELSSLGHDPWHGVEERPCLDETPWGICEDRVYAAAGPWGSSALRLTCASELRIAFGGPVKGPRRWRAAWLLAPLLRAMFACSPLARGATEQVKSARSRAWRFAEPSRTGFPQRWIEDPQGDAVEQYVDFALGARVLWVVHGERAFPQTNALSFRRWMQSGLGGEYPDLDDWRAHLATLTPPVRPALGLVLQAADALPRPFADVPLVLAGALLTDDAALEGTLELLAERASESNVRSETAWRDALRDEELAREARELFGQAADALLRAPRGWVSNAQLAAFVAYEQRFVRKGRTPSDDLLERFLERGHLDVDDLEGLETRWCEETGASISLRAAARPA